MERAHRLLLRSPSLVAPCQCKGLRKTDGACSVGQRRNIRRAHPAIRPSYLCVNPMHKVAVLCRISRDALCTKICCHIIAWRKQVQSAKVWLTPRELAYRILCLCPRCAKRKNSVSSAITKTGCYVCKGHIEQPVKGQRDAHRAMKQN